MLRSIVSLPMFPFIDKQLTADHRLMNTLTIYKPPSTACFMKVGAQLGEKVEDMKTIANAIDAIDQQGCHWHVGHICRDQSMSLVLL